MNIQSINLRHSAIPISVIDCCVGKGYRQGESGSLPDVDIDYQSDRRQEVKETLNADIIRTVSSVYLALEPSQQ